MINKLFGESLAMMLIGDGVLSLINPKRHVLLWSRGPQFWQNAMEPFARNTGITRAAGAAEIALGLWLATRAEPEA
jgi:hypothetical protein